MQTLNHERKLVSEFLLQDVEIVKAAWMKCYETNSYALQSCNILPFIVFLHISKLYFRSK